MKYADLCNRRLKEIGYREFFVKYIDIGEPNEEDECRFCCPVHAESSPSSSFNASNGKWKCFVPSCDAYGDAIALYGHITAEKNFREAARKLALELGIIDELTDDLVNKLHNNVINDEAVLHRACGMLGVSEKTIRRFKIGIDTRTFRFTIPIIGESLKYEDIRKYNRNQNPKITHWKSGHGDVRVFPFTVFAENKEVIFFAGEKDTMRAHEFGIGNAITVTAGEGKLPTDFANLFRDKIVYICFDIDEAGINGANSVSERLKHICEEVRIIRLDPVGLPKNGDFSDWVDLGNKLEDFEVLKKRALLVSKDTINAALLSSARNRDRSKSKDETTVPVVFQELQETGMHGKRIRFLAHAVGVSVGMKNYQSPSQLVVTCPRNQPTLCARCFVGTRVSEDDMPLNYDVKQSDEKALQLIRSDTIHRDKTVRDIIGIPDRCSVVDVKERRRNNIQTILLSAPVEMQHMRSGTTGFVIGYYTGPQIQDNKDYWFEGYVQADPRTQETVANLDLAERAKNALDDYKVSDETIRAVEYFRKREDETVEERFLRLHKMIEDMTGIYGRNEIQLALLECIFSVLRFKIGEKLVENCWIENLIMGDTRTGKSELASRLMKIVNVGELISCERISVSGIIGGIEFIEKVPVPVWGKFPQNDRGFIVMDEMGAISSKNSRVDIIGQMSSMRSSGIAEIVKIHQAKTMARVRAAYICNPLFGQQMSAFDGGVRAIPSIIKNLEDIARFTKAYAISGENVPIEAILQDKPVIIDAEVSEYFNSLAILTWSLTEHQITFLAETNKYLRSQALRLSNVYHPSIPLWEKGSGLNKLAKLSVPIAVLCGSFEEIPEEELQHDDEEDEEDRELVASVDFDTGEITEPEPKPRRRELRLIIKKEHAEYAVKMLEENYNGSTMGYLRYSKQEQAREKIVDAKEVITTMMNYRGIKIGQILSFFSANDELYPSSFAQMIGRKGDAEAIWSLLMVNNCIVPSKHGKHDCTNKTPAFVKLISFLLEDIDRATREQESLVSNIAEGEFTSEISGDLITVEARRD